MNSDIPTKLDTANKEREHTLSNNKSSYFHNLFAGRLNRRNYLLGNTFLFIIFMLFSLYVGDESTPGYGLKFFVMWVFMSFFSVSFSVRRLHDLGKSGWLILVSFVPIIQFILWGYLFFGRGQKDLNLYGNPSEQRFSLKVLLSLA